MASSLQAYESLWKSRGDKLGSVSLILSQMSDVRAAFSTRDQATIRDTAGELWAKISDEALLGPGEYFGEMALFSNLPRNATVRAIKSLDVLTIAKGDFTRLLATFPQFGAGVAGVAAERAKE